MESKAQNRKLEIIVAIIGIAIGVTALIFGILTCVAEVDEWMPWVPVNASFGADFYTYTYTAIRSVVSNLYILDYIAEYIQHALGYILIVGGLLIALVSVKKLCVAAKKPVEEAEQVELQSDDQNLQ